MDHQPPQGNTSKSNFYVNSAFPLDHVATAALSGSSPRVSPNFLSALPSPLNVNSTPSASSSSSSSSTVSGSSSSNNLHGPPWSSFESVIQALIQSREKEYIEFAKYRIFVGTWNVNGKNPTADLSDWLAVDTTPPDIYAIGFQELDLSKEAFLFSDSPREEEWLVSVAKSLHKGAEYAKVRLIRLIGMMLVVFIRKEHVELLSNVTAESVGTGLLGRMGNKGGVAIRLDLCNTSICFVNCHLAAHVEEYERRNQDFNEIISRLSFLQTRPIKSIKDHDQVYWFGDLNYRITDITSDQVKKMIDLNELDVLYQYDQLRIQQEKKKVLAGYNEGSLTFPPTYKYDIGTDDWDSSEKNRAPAWCDRVLWKGGPTKLLTYRSHPKLRLSDHKPVSAVFESSVKVIDQVRYKKTYQDIIKKIDKLENEFLPQVAVDQTDLNFGDVYFHEPVTRTLTIANVGQIVVLFSFLKKPNQVSFCKDWLRVSPSSSAIEPGDTVEIELEIMVDKKQAGKLTSGQEKINDILVLHLEKGRDLFISITGKYQASCFGSSIEALVRMKCPFREVSFNDLTTLHRGGIGVDIVKQCELLNLDTGEEPPPCWDIPKEIWVLVDRLYQKGLDQKELFLRPGLNSELLKIREALDTGQMLDENCCIFTVAESLLLLLDSFIEPVIPYSMYQSCMDSSQNFGQCKQVCLSPSACFMIPLTMISFQQVILQLPTAHKHVFFYIVSFIREYLRNGKTNHSDIKVIGKSLCHVN